MKTFNPNSGEALRDSKNVMGFKKNVMGFKKTSPPTFGAGGAEKWEKYGNGCITAIFLRTPWSSSLPAEDARLAIDVHALGWLHKRR